MHRDQFRQAGTEEKEAAFAVTGGKIKNLFLFFSLRCFLFGLEKIALRKFIRQALRNEINALIFGIILSL